MPISARAITINQTIGRIDDADYYDDYLTYQRVGLLFSLSTQDAWQTADFGLTVRSHLLWSNDLFFGLSAAAQNQGIIASDFRGTGYIDYSDPASPGTDVFMSGSHNDRFGFTLSSTNSGYSVWDALTVGFRIDHFFFGNEMFNSAIIQLTYPGITSYEIQLADAAAVPIPPAFALLAGAFGLLGIAARRGQMHRESCTSA